MSGLAASTGTLTLLGLQDVANHPTPYSCTPDGAPAFESRTYFAETFAEAEKLIDELKRAVEEFTPAQKGEPLVFEVPVRVEFDAATMIGETERATNYHATVDSAVLNVAKPFILHL